MRLHFELYKCNAFKIKYLHGNRVTKSLNSVDFPYSLGVDGQLMVESPARKTQMFQAFEAHALSYRSAHEKYRWKTRAEFSERNMLQFHKPLFIVGKLVNQDLIL
jgi:hypothetical protein